MVLKRVLTKVDLPKPDSPMKDDEKRPANARMTRRTNDHYGELEAFSHALTMDLIGKVSETNVSHEFLADDWGNSGKVDTKGGT